MFKFEYHYYEKYSKRDGFGIVIDNNFDSLEVLLLDNLGKIKSITFYNYNQDIKEKINDFLNSLDFRLVNSYIYSNCNNDNEKMIYIENDKYNRKVEGNDIFSNEILKNIFNRIKLFLKDIIVIEETFINKISEII